MDGWEQNEPGANGGSRFQRATRTSLQSRLERHIWRRMSAGVLVLIPLLVTVLVLRLVIVSIDGVVRPLYYVRDRPWDFVGIGLLVVLVVFYIVGAVITSRAGRRVVDWQGFILSRIPLVRNIYNVAAQATAALSAPNAERFRRVVLVEWPRPGVKAIGFVTGHLPSPSEPGRALVVVYIPTAPNPTSGFVAFMSEEDIVETDFSVEQAMKLVFSGGIVLPEPGALDSEFKLTERPRN